MRWFLAFLALFLMVVPGSAQVKEEPLVQKVKRGIDKGVKYLKDSQRGDGSWEVNLPSAAVHGGWTALAVLSLLNAGVPLDESHLAKGLVYLRALEPTSTYVRALQTMVFVEASQAADRERPGANIKQDQQRIQANIKWLIDARVFKNDKFIGWTYGRTPTGSADNSNTQYALLGLWAGRQAGMEINREIWESIRDFYLRDQKDSGGWPYAKDGQGWMNRETLTMTTAGLCGLLIAGMELNAGREELLDNGTATGCGEYRENQPTAKGLSWVSKNFQVDFQRAVFYNLYGLERAGRLTGQRFFGQFDWYREGCDYLVRNQRADGSWLAGGGHDSWPVVSTSFALLFLSKGRTPVLVSKLVHGAWGPLGRNEFDLDWNNDRNDLRHLVDFSSKKLFRNLPLAWQTFDLMRAAGAENITDDKMLGITSEMLQSPIFYVNGHESPLLRLRPLEKELLKKYIENGGFIVAEACCGNPEFDRGFKALAAQLWPNNDLSYLDEKHAVWRSFFTVAPGKPSKLMGISMGCKTVLIYSPQDLSCRWESNKLEQGAVLEAFKLGANIIAYATGLEPPRPRLTEVKVARDKDPEGKIPRGFYKVAQLRHRGDWPAPRAMRNLMDYLNQQAALDVDLKTTPKDVDDKELIDYKFVYMHGRGQFTFEAEALKHLRFNLQSGGLLFADACCGKEAFDKSFRDLTEQLFPDKKLEDVPLDDLLYSKDLNGEALDEGNIKCRSQAGKVPRPMPPALEGVKLNNRWAVLYSKYDIGCALEGHQSSDCLGYTPESAKKLAGAAVLYTLRP